MLPNLIAVNYDFQINSNWWCEMAIGSKYKQLLFVDFVNE